MFISKLSIRNFRNFRNVSFSFKEGVNTILGENGSGKTNLFRAIRILIDENMPRTTQLYDNDFNRSIGNWIGHWIIIQITFSKLDASEEAQSLAMHKIGEANEVDSTKGTYSFFFRPRIDFRRSLYSLSIDKYKNSEKLTDILSNMTLNDYESIFTGRGNVDFVNEEDYLKYVGDFNKIDFPDPDEERTDIYGIKIYSSSIPNEFSCTFAKALRDVEADLKSYRGNPLLNLLRDKEKNIEIAKKVEIEGSVEDLNTKISELSEVQEVSYGITDNIKQAVGETYAPTVSIKSELPSNMEKLLQSLKLWVGDPGEDSYEGRLWELSLGGANLIYISLKLLEFERITQQNKIANFILIEEPEAHIHTHIQKTLFQNLHKRNTQVFITTHSTHISSVSKISSMNILGRGRQLAELFDPANNLEDDEITRLERYLDASRSNLLFAKGVLLVEGDAEQILVPAMIKNILGISLDEIGISLINIGSTGFTNIAKIFHPDRVRRKCAIITDNDISIEQLPENEEDDTQYQKKCRNSQISGVARKQKLEKFHKDNEYIKAFYAKHTFEIDFIAANNVREIEDTVEKAYKKIDTIIKIKERLNDENVSIYGKEMLRLAEKFYKGWFSIMVSENVTNITCIPDYIIDAIIFASPNLPRSTISTMAIYRLKAFINNSFDGDKKDYAKLLKEYSKFDNSIDAIKFYKSKLPDDILVKLIDNLSC